MVFTESVAAAVFFLSEYRTHMYPPLEPLWPYGLMICCIQIWNGWANI